MSARNPLTPGQKAGLEAYRARQTGTPADIATAALQIFRADYSAPVELSAPAPFGGPPVTVTGRRIGPGFAFLESSVADDMGADWMQRAADAAGLVIVTGPALRSPIGRAFFPAELESN